MNKFRKQKRNLRLLLESLLDGGITAATGPMLISAYRYTIVFELEYRYDKITRLVKYVSFIVNYNKVSSMAMNISYSCYFEM